MNDLIIHKKVSENPVAKKVDINNLKVLQELVGGYITTVRLPHNILLVCNDEGMLLNLPINFYLNEFTFYGDVFFCSHDTEDFTGLNEQQFEYIKNTMFEFFDMEGEI